MLSSLAVLILELGAAGSSEGHFIPVPASLLPGLSSIYIFLAWASSSFARNCTASVLVPPSPALLLGRSFVGQ